jgi:hypothetical protein
MKNDESTVDGGPASDLAVIRALALQELGAFGRIDPRS